MAGLLRPPLSSIKPDVKVPVDERAFFDALSPSPFMPLPPMAMVEAFPGAYYIDGCLSREECQGLCDACDQCQDLRFWSSAGRDDASARAFRDADTVEVRAERLAAALWARIHHLLPSGMAAGQDDRWQRLGALHRGRNRGRGYSVVMKCYDHTQELRHISGREGGRTCSSAAPRTGSDRGHIGTRKGPDRDNAPAPVRPHARGQIGVR